ncbi:MAG: hypothetical protein ABJ013_12330 [Halioglobus sp.]
MRLVILVLFTLCGLAACSSKPPTAANDPLNQSSAVAVTLPGFVTGPTTTLHWHSDVIWADDDTGQFEHRGKVLQSALQEEFERKGYQFVDDAASATYDVVAVAMLGDVESHSEILEVFRLYPALAQPAKGYDKGTVMVAIVPEGTKDIVWRGALQVFTDPGLMPVEQRQQRLEWGARQVLGSIPSVR